MGPRRFADAGRAATIAEPSRDLVELAVATVRHGCVNEACAAFVVAGQLAEATDPTVRAVLERVAREEAEHAALAWRVVRWAIDAGGAPVRDAVARAFDALAAPSAEGLTERAVPGHGLLDPRRRAALHREALERVVRPCARALLRTEAAASR